MAIDPKDKNFLPFVRGGQGGVETLPPLGPLLTKEGKTGAEEYAVDPNPRPATQNPRTWFGSIAARFSVRGRVEEICATLPHLKTAADETVLTGFRLDLSELVHCRQLQEPVVRIALGRLPQDPWIHLFEVATGKLDRLIAVGERLNPTILGGRTRLYLRGLHAVATYQPREAEYLAGRLFENGGLTTRLQVQAAVILSPNLGTPETVSRQFLKLMAATTHEERETTVYPALADLSERALTSFDPKTRAKGGRQKVLLDSWRREEAELT